MCNHWLVFMISLVRFAGFSSASAAPPAKLVSQVVSRVVSALFKRLWSLKTDAPVAISGRSVVKFEGGYTVETLFDGSKHGIEPYSVELSPTGDLLVLDCENSNLYKISTPLLQYSRPKLIAGSSEGYHGHIDRKLREARMHHPDYYYSAPSKLRMMEFFVDIMLDVLLRIYCAAVKQKSVLILPILRN